MTRWPFVPGGDRDHREWMVDRKRFVLWQATGIIIDDTDFGTATDLARRRYWFPPCTHQRTPQWWAKLRTAAERVEEAFRTGEHLHTHNFAEEVVLASVLRSDALTQIIEYLDYDEPEEYLTIAGHGETDLDFENVLPDMADDGDAELLFVDDSRPGLLPAVIEGVLGDPEHWFDPYSARCSA